MNRTRLIPTALMCLILWGCNTNATDRYDIIPRPETLQAGRGEFALTPGTAVWCDAASEVVAQQAAAFLRQATGYPLPVEVAGSGKRGTGIRFTTLPGSAAESYTLEVTPKRINIAASGPAGLFYGFQSLRQLLPPQIEEGGSDPHARWSVPAVSIRDSPRYKWRGFMLDVSRTFYDVDIVKKYLDAMALYKLNTFHFHLTDDQGWRIEIKKYPELTSKIATEFPAHHNQPAERSGFYTQDQIRELVAYAAERHITIVPEIDVPGHCWPVLLLHPELGVNKSLTPNYVMPFLTSWSYWGTQFIPNALDPTKEAVYTFLDDVFTEVAALFPGEYIHFGGDEVKHHIWEDEPHIQAFMKQHGYKGFGDLQSYFVNRVAAIIISKGKKPMGWSDILKGAETLDRSVVAMSWLRDLQYAVEGGFHTVAVPSGCLYLDISQADRNDGTMSDLAGEVNTLQAVYAYDPSEGLTPEQDRYVFGIQANMWTHIAVNTKDMNVQIFPRLLALSEIAWTGKPRRDYDDFLTRLDAHYPRLEAMKFDHYRPGGYIAGNWSPADLAAEFRPLEWDVTKKVYAEGRVKAGFFHLSGNSFMKIRKVELLENGRVISSDPHPGLADDTRATSLPKTYFYDLKVDRYDPDAAYTLRAEVAGETSNDSSGNFTFNLSPYQPFAVTEPK